jgi:methyl-accepting chemotaxis protein
MDSRRAVTLGVVISLLLGVLAGRMSASGDAGKSPASPAATPDAVRARLTDGNARFVAGQCEHPNSDTARRTDTAANGQHPVVTVVSCSDSRVPVERIFDQGVGDVFVIRVAGNVCGTDELGSVEYGVDHLGTPLLVVLGHSQCGAVTAAVTKAAVHGSIPALIDQIAPAVEAARKDHPALSGNDLVPAAIQANVWQGIHQVLSRSEAVRNRVNAGQLMVVGAIYDLSDGTVVWLGTHPEQATLLETKASPGGHGTSAHETTAAPAPATAHVPAGTKAATAHAPPANAQGEHATGSSAAASTSLDVMSRASRPAETRAGASLVALQPTKETSRVPAQNVRSGESWPWYLGLSVVVIIVLGFAILRVRKSGQNQGGNKAMFKNMKLGSKIGAGFASLIVIAVTLGGLAVWSMYGVKSTAVTLSEAYVPAVQVANEVERDSLHTMYETRGYAYTEDTKFLEKAKTNLEKVKKDLVTAKEHADKFDLPLLREHAQEAEKAAGEYEQLLNETVAATEELAKEKEAMNTAAADYMKICAEYLSSQQKSLDEEIHASLGAKSDGAAGEAKTEAVSADKLVERAKKIAVANEIVDLGNAIRIGAWKSIATRDPDHFQETQKMFAEVNRKLDELKATTTREVNLKQIEACRAAGKAYEAGMTGFLNDWLAREEIGKKRGVAAEVVLTAAAETAKANMEKTAGGSQEAASSLSTSSTTMIIGLAIAVVVGILMAVFITRSIVAPITRVITGLTDGSQQVSAASAQVSGASQSLAEGSSEQASSLEETSSSLEEMSSMTKQNAANAKQANSLADEALTASSRGDEAVKRMADAIGRIKQSSDETARIIKVIDEIAFQTNLLALNAAVEAARAGEAGKGFAVVAEEVRNLAQRSAEAAKNTAQLIDGAQKNADDGVKVTEDVTEALKEIGGGIKKVTDLLAEVSAASDEQSRGIEQINTAVGQMDQVTQQVAANAEESAAASEELSSQAEQLNEMVAELAAVVGGSNREGMATTTKRRPAVTAAQASATHASAGHPEIKRPVKKTVAKSAAPQHSEPKAKAEDVIPLHEHEDSAVLSKF